jgi:hypothetical protein
MLRKRVNFLGDKRGVVVAVSLVYIIKLITGIILFVFAVTLLLRALDVGVTKQLSQPERDLQRIAAEIRDVRPSDQPIPVSVFGEGYELWLYGKGSKEEIKCKGMACLCAYDSSTGETIDCEIFETIQEPGKGMFAERSHKTIEPRTTDEEGQQIKQSYSVTILVGEDSVRIS